MFYLFCILRRMLIFVWHNFAWIINDKLFIIVFLIIEKIVRYLWYMTWLLLLSFLLLFWLVFIRLYRLIILYVKLLNHNLFDLNKILVFLRNIIINLLVNLVPLVIFIIGQYNLYWRIQYIWYLRLFMILTFAYLLL